MAVHTTVAMKVLEERKARKVGGLALGDALVPERK